MKNKDEKGYLISMKGLILLLFGMYRNEEPCNKDKIKSFLMALCERLHKKGIKDSPNKLFFKILQMDTKETAKWIEMIFYRYTNNDEVADIFESVSKIKPYTLESN